MVRRKHGAAIKEVQEGGAFKTAAKTHQVPVMILKRRVKGINKKATGHKKVLGRPQTLNKEFEDELVQYLLDMEVRFYGLTKKDVCKLAFELAVKNDVPHQFNIGKGHAGNDWFTAFMRRHQAQLSLRKPEATSAARAQSFNKVQVNRFFDLYEQELQKYNFSPTHIFNVDETGIQTTHQPPKILAQKGKKQVGAIVSAERGTNVTAVVGMSASGQFVPPMLVFPRVRMSPELSDGAPPGTLVVGQEKGWINSELSLSLLCEIHSR